MQYKISSVYTFMIDIQIDYSILANLCLNVYFFLLFIFFTSIITEGLMPSFFKALHSVTSQFKLDFFINFSQSEIVSCCSRNLSDLLIIT